MKRILLAAFMSLLLVGTAVAQFGETYINGVRQAGGGGGGTWGSIQGTLSDQVDLWTELTNRYTKAEIDAFGFLTTETDPIWSAVSNLYATTNWVLSQGYVTASITNGLAATDWVLAQNYVTASITNGLASTNWVLAQGYGSTNWVLSQGYVTASITNGLAATDWVLAQNYVTASITNGLASTNWVLSQGYVTASITNGLASTSWVVNLPVSTFTNDAGYVGTSDFNEGVVKINANADGSDPQYSLSDGVEQQLTYTAPPQLDPTSDFPENGTNDWNAIYYTNGVSTNIFLENQVLGQAQFWRMDVSWSNKAVNSAAGLSWIIENPVSGFRRTMQITLPNGITSGRTTFPVIYTYTDTNSAAPPLGGGLGGYEFYLRADDDDFDVTVNDVTRHCPQHN